MFIVRSIKKCFDNSDIKTFTEFSYGEIISFILLYLISFLINKNLSEEELGAFSYNYNLILFIYPILSLNIFEGYLRFLVVKDINTFYITSTIRRAAFISTLILFFILLIIFGEVKLAFLSFIILYNERLYFFRGNVQTKIYNYLKVLSSILILFFVIILMANSCLNYANIIFSYGLSYLIAAVIGHIFPTASSLSTIGNKIQLSTLVKYSLPIVGTGLLTWLLNFSALYYIEHFFSLKEVGEYSISNRALNILRVISGLFLLYWPIIYFKSFDDKNFKHVQHIRIIYFVVLILFSTTTIIFSKLIYVLIGAEKYLDFLVYFKILSVAEFFRITAGILMTYRSFNVQTYFNLISIFFVTALNLFLNYFFLERYGVVFAAYSTLIATFSYFLISIIISFIPECKYIKRN